MVSIVRMPSVLAGSSEAAIANWLVGPGDSIAVGDPIAEIETEKAIVEYNAEEAGVVGRLVLDAGASGEIGAPIAVLIAEGDSDADIDAALGGVAAPAPAESGAAAASDPSAASPSAPEVLDAAAGGRDPESAVAAGTRDPEAGAPVVEAASVQVAPAQAGATDAADRAEPSAPAPESATDGERLFASPIARKLARERGVDVATLTGSGPGGRIVRRDVEAAPSGSLAAPVADSGASGSSSAAAPTATTVPGASPAASRSETGDPEFDLVPHTGMRRAIARRLTESKSTVPHFYLTTECRVDELLALRARINATSPVKISVNDFVVKAVAAAFADVPEANVTWSDEGMRQHRTVDIAVAVATEGGLVTPVVRDVGAASLSRVSSEISALVQKAKDRRLKQDELEGGSFSVSNLGMYGTLEFSAILNPPQSGILAVGAAKPQPVVVEGQLAVATVMRCTLSVDHRAVDGALAARWLAAFTQKIENPLSMLV
ncbi:2-oxo acid dehydrogenase subunit E2 [Herbiconiux ginsengi]|uniref:Dihydrolipoamide acetyltransferase component of pyruvate dehydrogenase complex n=1 Tax=Herbiconiux ginsengi TaxID=381665 RepID=A0A1H3QP36_9MICO|nr:2-oxo acid dehydrogenase subunit E2 [Herbiconiux ginsengi]SDZ15166.1 pyruvate dehydrogenase E2 component (dihydrolipoamide acetyltransferase) [Herbiconiux ginsengi]